MEPRNTQNTRKAERRRNWSLLLGAIIVAVVALAALFGPTFAPKDPLQNYFITEVNGDWVRAPFPPFVTPDFPLGSDRFGRDLLSRVLWAVRPTLLLVALVAATRLLLGIVIGIVSGWSNGRLGRWLDTLISAALSVPVLVVALGVIALLGRTLDFWAFVIGLALTGWAETARVLREETRTVKSQQYIEAGRALGMSGFRLVWRHVLRQITPMAWMFLAIEIGAALLTLAGLGFLGYYVGGNLWIMIGDFTASRVSGMPELGEMLATSSGVLDSQPWAMLAIGAIVFLIILGFNLLGEGLRNQLEYEAQRRRSRSAMVTSLVGEQIETKVLMPLADRLRRPEFRLRAGLVAAVILVASIGLIAWQTEASRPPLRVEAVPGDHLWGSERRDPQGTLTTDVTGVSHPQIAWVFTATGGLSGGPAVAKDGTLYVASISNTLYALNPSGQTVWTATLPVPAVGGPALGANGDVYVADRLGGLTAVSASGALLWQYQPDHDPTAIGGPIVMSDGTIVYPIEGYLIAVRPTGELRWRGPTPYSFLNPAVRLGTAGDVAFFADVAIDTSTGRPLVKETVNPLDQFIAAADGRMYMIGDKELLEWRETEQGTAIVQLARMDYTRRYPGAPADGGVLTQQQLMWLFFGNEFQDSRIIWMEPSGKVTGAALVGHRPARIIAVDRDATIYECGMHFGAGVECAALPVNAGEPMWTLSLAGASRFGGLVQGGALVEGRLYVTLAEGRLYAIENRAPGSDDDVGRLAQ